MKIHITLILLFIGSINSYAQQDFMFSQYMHNEIVINPAYAGSQGQLSATGIYRKQWVNIDGAPVTQSINLNGLAHDNIGYGIIVNNDKIGISNDFSIYGATSYIIDLQNEYKLQLGVQAGVTRFRADINQLLIKDVEDPLLQEDVVSKTLPNFGTGAYLFNKNWYVGASVPRLLNNNVNANNVQILQKKRHYFVTSGFVRELSANIKIKPSVFVKYIHGAPIEVDISSNIIFNEKIWFGVAYRSFDSVDFLALLQVDNQLRIGYAYDWTLTSLGNFTSGSHEIMLNYRRGKNKEGKVMSPRFF